MANKGHASTVDARLLGHGLGVHVVNDLDDDREEDEMQVGTRVWTISENTLLPSFL